MRILYEGKKHYCIYRLRLVRVVAWWRGPAFLACSDALSYRAFPTTTMVKWSSAGQPRNMINERSIVDISFPLNHYNIPFHKRDDCESETSISEKSTDTDSEMSEYDRWVLNNRYSRPQYMDRWDIFSLKRVRCNWLWTEAARIPAADPLSEADTLSALLDILRSVDPQKEALHIEWCAANNKWVEVSTVWATNCCWMPQWWYLMFRWQTRILFMWTKSFVMKQSGRKR